MTTTRNKSLSDFWRIDDKSDDRIIELGRVLQGASSIIGVMGSGVHATWGTGGQSSTCWYRLKTGEKSGTQVFLDYSPLKDLQAPFDGKAVDEVIGYAVHEGGHCLWTDGDSKRTVITALRRINTAKARQALTQPDEVMRVGNIIEDAYVDCHVAEKWPVLGEYIRYARQKTAEGRPIDLDAIAQNPKPARNSVMNLWIALTLYEADIPPKMSVKVKRVISQLIEYSVQAAQNPRSWERIEISVKCWALLVKEFPLEDEVLPQKPPQIDEPSGPSDETEASGPSGEGDEASEAGEDESGSGEGEGDAPSDDEPSEGDAPSDAPSDEPSDDAPSGDAPSDDAPSDEPSEADEPSDAPSDDSDAPSDEPSDEPSEAGEDGIIGDGDGDGGGAGSGGAPTPRNLDEFDLRDAIEAPADVVEKVLDALIHELEDLSGSVAEILNQPIEDIIATTKKADYDGPAAARICDSVVSETTGIRRIFERQAALKSRSLKGMPSGKLDRRSLHKVATGNMRVYKRREVLGKPDLAVGLLLDVSGSMYDDINTVWATAAVFSEALARMSGVNFLCLTYTGSFSETYTTKLCDREMGRLCLGNVVWGHGTPSGGAIASMRVLMSRMPEKQRVLIHFSDGQPDDRNAVVTAVSEARDKGFRVWAIGLPGYESMLEAQYGDGNWVTIGAVADLPAKVGELIKTLVIGK